MIIEKKHYTKFNVTREPTWWHFLLPLRIIFLVIYIVFIIKQLVHLLKRLLNPSLDNFPRLRRPQLHLLVAGLSQNVALALEHVVLCYPRQAFLTPYQTHRAYLEQTSVK
jgi:hypothetical protein